MNEQSQLSSTDIDNLVLTSQKGESEAFAKLYDFFVDAIYRYIYYRVGSREAEDLTELVFLKTWENIKQYRCGGRGFSAWLFRIAHNIVVDYYRSVPMNGELSEDIQDERREANTQNRAHNHFDNAVLTDAMKELKGQYRQILVLRYVNELSYEEIGYIMGRSQAALRILQYRALRNLKAVLERKGVTEA